ncbi:regulatory particle non-ATPase [Thecaphora frezii]
MSATLRAQHDALLHAFSTSSDLGAMRTQLTKLKIALTEAGLLVPSPEAKPEELVLARDVLEVGAFWSIRTKDVESFDRYMNLLRAYYNDYAPILPSSQNHQPLLGLSLLRLLSSNEIASFHTALETLPPDLVRDSPYLQHPVNLERWLMEGSYSKVWRARQQAPREEYSFFVDRLMGTIRHEIASCEEKAYDSLPLSDAATLLFFDNLQDVLGFANERGWQINPTTQIVHFANTAANANTHTIPKKATITTNLLFAKELESIV